MQNSLLDYLPLRHKPENINVKHKQSLNLQDKLALAITTAVGTMYAVYIFILFMVGWMLWQSYFSQQPFDPYPFAFLLFLGNIVQLLLLPLILVGQNLQSRHAEIRTEEEFKTTQSSYRDIESILVHLDEQDKQIKKQIELIAEISKSLKK
ncbi:DUF1003 domain-containing protein [Candidatus Daviesbacteria bacterium]|nr:DUF1003 domain-containing protein [Candidatus Daviesbacteria bacterium]